MRRAKKIIIRHRDEQELARLADQAVYTGSGEHKDRRWWHGLPESGNRAEWQTTTICPLYTLKDRHRATEWVRDAIRLGQCRFFQEDKNFPKKIWYEADDQIWMGMLINDGTGEYKGWPIGEDERHEIFD